MKNLVYVNGDFLAADAAALPVLDRGYLYGEGLFETMRAYGGRIFALDQHLHRLLSSATELGVDIGVGEDGLARAVELTLEANELSDAYLRLTVSQRCDAPGIESRSPGRSTVSVIAQPLAPRREEQPAGIRATVLAAGSAPPASLARHKTLSFLAYVRARAAARAAEADEGLLVNAAGEITESSTANVFFVIDNRLVTAPVECGLLPGVTRAIVLRLASREGIHTSEEPIRPSDVRACSECFLTNSIIELAPATYINREPIGSGVPGPVCSALAAAYSRATAAASGS